MAHSGKEEWLSFRNEISEELLCRQQEESTRSRRRGLGWRPPSTTPGSPQCWTAELIEAYLAAPKVSLPVKSNRNVKQFAHLERIMQICCIWRESRRTKYKDIKVTVCQFGTSYISSLILYSFSFQKLPHFPPPFPYQLGWRVQEKIRLWKCMLWGQQFWGEGDLVKYICRRALWNSGRFRISLGVNRIPLNPRVCQNPLKVVSMALRPREMHWLENRPSHGFSSPWPSSFSLHWGIFKAEEFHAWFRLQNNGENET